MMTDDAERILNSAIISIYVEANDERIYLEVNADFFINDEIAISSSKVIIDISFNDFEEIDVYDGSYFIIPGNNIDYVTIKNDLSKKTRGYVYYDKHVYLTDLEAGHYIINTFGGEGFSVKVYDRQRKEIKHLMELKNFDDIVYTFEVDSDGEYYIELDFSNMELDSIYEFQISKIDVYDAYELADPKIVKLGLLKFAIDNIYNITALNYYEYQNERGIIVFQSRDDKRAIFYPGSTTVIDKNDTSQDTYAFDTNFRENIFFVYGPVNEYRYDVMIFRKDKYNGSSKTYLLDPLIWTDNLVLSSQLSSSHFNIEIAEAGYIHFESDLVAGNVNNLIMGIAYGDEYDYEIIYDVIEQDIYLTPGKYRIFFESNYPLVTKVRYTFTSSE